MNFQTEVVQSVPANRRQHGWEFSGSIPVVRAGVTTWTMKNAAEMLECARQRPVIQSRLLACEFDGEGGGGGTGKLHPFRFVSVQTRRCCGGQQ